MIHYKGHTISEEFAGINKPAEHVVRCVSACGVVGMSLLGSFASLDEAKAAIDASADGDEERACRTVDGPAYSIDCVCCCDEHTYDDCPAGDGCRAAVNARAKESK